MRTLFSMLAFYMLAVFLMPCADVFDEEILPNCNKSEQVFSELNHEHSEHTDLCSPFCLCNCCGMTSSFVHETQIHFAVQKFSIFTLTKTFYISDFKSAYHGKIWQPPQITA